MWLLGNKTAEEDVAEAHARQKAGFDFFKLKIGVKPLAKEIAIAFAVREALPNTPLCADANCGLTLAAARSYVEKTRKAKLMFVEQPLAYDDIEGLRKLARGTKVPIGVDEGIHSFADITTSAKAGAGGVSLKLIKLGGIIAAIEAGKLCQRLGLSVNIAAKIAEFEHLQRGGAASCLRGAEGRLGRQPHALLSGRGYRPPTAPARKTAWSPCPTAPASASRSTRPPSSVSKSAKMV